MARTPANPQRGPGRPPGGEEQTRRTRAKIRAAAIELFADQGFHGASVAQIGARAGVQPGALYHHIGSKEELLAQLLLTHVQEALADARAVAASDLTPSEKLRELIHRHVKVIAARRREVTIYLRERDVLTGQRGAELRAARHEVESTWAQVVADGVACGELVAGDHVIVNGLFGLVNYVHLWYRPDGSDTPEQIAEKFSAMVLHGLLSPDLRG